MLLKKPMGQWRNQRGNQKIRQIKKIFPKAMGHSKSSSKREVYSNTGLPQEPRKMSINNLTFPLKEI